MPLACCSGGTSAEDRIRIVLEVLRGEDQFRMLKVAAAWIAIYGQPLANQATMGLVPRRLERSGEGPMFFRSLFYERTVLSLLEEVKQLPGHVQAEIATRVGNYIAEAKKADAAALSRFVGAARKEREAITAKTDQPTLAQIAGPALAEAWCVARLGLSEASMDQHCAITIVAAIEAFALNRPTV